MAQAAGADANGLISIDRFVKQLVVSSEWDEILRIFQNRKQEMFGDQTSPTLDKKNKKRMVAIAKDQAFKRALGRMQEINMKQFEVFANEHIQELMGVGPEESRKILRAHSRRQSRDDRETLQNAGRGPILCPFCLVFACVDLFLSCMCLICSQEKDPRALGCEGGRRCGSSPSICDVGACLETLGPLERNY